MKRVPLLSACLALFAAPALAGAHGLGVEAVVKEGKLVVSAFYDDDTDAVGAAVQLLDGARTLASAKTDAKGCCAFDLPPPGKYDVVVDAGAGHRARQPVTVPAKRPTPAPSAAAREHEPREARPEPGPDSADGVVSDGPTRQERTAYPWLKIGIGIGVIGALALAFLAAKVLRSPG